MQSPLATRKANFAHFLDERMPVLVEFAKSLGFQDPHRIVTEPHLFLPEISDWLAHQDITPEDRTWLTTRLGYLVGELLISRFGGLWFINEIESSKYFGRYVVGQFASASNKNAQVDPFEVAVAAVNNPSSSLVSLFSEVCGALNSA